MKDIELFNISVEEFDNMNEKHEFSKEYNENKKEMMQDYKKNIHFSNRAKYARIAAVAAVVMVSSPFIANAATHGDLFSRIWGTGGRKTIESHTEVAYDEEKGTSEIATYPKREYVDVDEDKADELIGDNLSFPNIKEEINGTTLTILSAVKDKNSAVVEFTLENPNGVDSLEYGQDYNETKGAEFADKTTFVFSFCDEMGNIYVDLDRSTDNKLYCYEYLTLEGITGDLEMRLEKFPCPFGEYHEMDDQLRNSEVKNITIPISENISMTEMKSTTNGQVDISPISMRVDCTKGLGLSEVEANDPWNIYYVSVNYKDGSQYVVSEHAMDGVHDCGVEIDNTNYVCGQLDGGLVFLFNRLVDVNDIASVTVNDVEYTLH